jgi:hypothetical protein
MQGRPIRRVLKRQRVADAPASVDVTNPNDAPLLKKRKEVDSSQASSEVHEGPIRNDRFYFEDGNVTFLVCTSSVGYLLRWS